MAAYITDPRGFARVPGYDGYWVHPAGFVRGPSGRVLKTRPDGLSVSLTLNKKVVPAEVAFLLWRAWERPLLTPDQRAEFYRRYDRGAAIPNLTHTFDIDEPTAHFLLRYRPVLEPKHAQEETRPPYEAQESHPRPEHPHGLPGL